MTNIRNVVAASLAACSVYIVYFHIYRSRRLLRRKVLCSDTLPSLVYLYIKFFSRAVSSRKGCLRKTAPQNKNFEAEYTVTNCRLDSVSLRRFCSAAGYGWDYPDTEYRDIPLCFPEFLCGRLMLMLLTDDNFRLNPAGLVRVGQSLKTFQPIDELKKGRFSLRVQVLVYRQTDAGVEVDICLSAMSRSGSPVWESVLTLLSNKQHPGVNRGLTQSERENRPNELEPENMKEVQLRVPWRTNELCWWSFSDHSLYRLLSLPVRLLGSRSQTAPSLWMLSVCLAEIEKHKGVEAVTAPAKVTAQFNEPLLIPGDVIIKFWETDRDGDQTIFQDLGFQMQQKGSSIPHLVGMISRN